MKVSLEITESATIQCIGPIVHANRLKRFLLVSGDFVRTGGMDVSNYFLADYLARKGMPVHIVSHNVDPELKRYPNVFHHYAPRPWRSTVCGEPILNALGRRVAQKLGGPVDGTRIIVNGGNCPLPDVNWIHYLHAAMPPMPSNGFVRQAKTMLASRVFQRTEKVALRRARIIIANSQRTKADIIRCYGIDASRIHTVHYGTDPGEFYTLDEKEKIFTRRALGFPAEKYLIVFIGALGDRRKGFDTLFEAWKTFGVEGEAIAELLVIGSGSDLPQWQDLASKHPAGRAIRFLGFRRDVPAILRVCDAIVAPTRYEAFGLAVMEALCCGLPAIVSREAGVVERCSTVLDDLLLRDPESVAELIVKMRNLLANRTTWAHAMKPLSSDLRKYTWDDMADKIFRLVEPL